MTIKQMIGLQSMIAAVCVGSNVMITALKSEDQSNWWSWELQMILGGLIFGLGIGLLFYHFTKENS